MPKYGIAFTHDGSPTGAIMSWKENKKFEIQLWDTREQALEANDLSGWGGYVKEFDRPGPGNQLRQETLQLIKAGWHLLCGEEEFYWGHPENYKLQYTHGQALVIQKVRDNVQEIQRKD